MTNKVIVGIRLQADNVGGFVADNKRAAGALVRTRKSAVTASKGVTTLSASISRTNDVLRTALGVGLATGIVSLGKSAFTSSDQFRVLEARIRVATIATGDYEDVSSRLFQISQKNGTSLRETIKLFQNLARIAPELDANNDQMIEMLDLVQKVGVTSGASFEDMKFAMRQFGQSMASGIVRAEEFNSIVENVPELAFQIAKGMGTTVGQLRLAVVEGRVLSKEVFEAINTQADEIDLIFRGFPRSIEQTTTALNAGMSRALSKVNEQLSFGTDEFADTLDNIAESLSSFAEDDKAVKELVEDIESLVGVGKVLVSTYLAFKAGGLIVGGFRAVRGQVKGLTAEVIALNGVTAKTSLKSAGRFTPVVARRAPGALGALGGSRGKQFPKGFGVLKSASQAAPINTLTKAVRGLGAAGAATLGILGGWPVILATAGVAAASYAASTLLSKDETEDFNETLLKLEGNISSLRLRSLNTDLADYKTKLQDAEQAAIEYIRSNTDAADGTIRFSKELKRLQGDVVALRGIVSRYKDEIRGISQANAELAQNAGLVADKEYSDAFLAKLDEVIQKQRLVGLTKREIAVQAIENLRISDEEKAKLADETNALHDKIEADKASSEQLRRRKQLVSESISQASKFSTALEKQITTIQQSITALTLEGRQLEVHNALMLNGLDARIKLSAADELRKQRIVSLTQAYFDQKQAVDSLNTAVDEELNKLERFKQLRDELNPNDVRDRTYKANLELIEGNTAEGSEAQERLKGQLFEKYRGEVTDGFGVEATTFEEKLQEVRDQFEQRRQVVLENTALTEQQRTELEVELAQARNQRIQAIEQERAQFILQNNATLFGELAGIAKTFAGEQSGIFKVLFAASKAFAIAESIIKIQQGIAAAASLPFPTNIPAIASVVSATAGVVSTIKGTNLPSFEGGGYTGSGPRAGGVDNKGGFNAILHPNETVIDHTKQRSSSGISSIKLINSGNMNAEVTGASISRGELTIMINSAIDRARPDIVNESVQASAGDVINGGGILSEAIEGIYGSDRAVGARR